MGEITAGSDYVRRHRGGYIRYQHIEPCGSLSSFWITFCLGLSGGLTGWPSSCFTPLLSSTTHLNLTFSICGIVLGSAFSCLGACVRALAVLWTCALACDILYY
jgi:hypothetical protein